jgi:hypothetical protein
MYNTSSQPEFSFTGTWPRDYYRYGTISFHWNATAIGRYRNAEGQDVLRHVETWPSNSGYRGSPPYGIREYMRVRPPVTYLEAADGSIAPVSRRFEGEIDPDLPSDQMIELRYKTPPGFDITKRSYSFSNRHHGDYMIQHNQYVVTFDADEDPGPDIGMDTSQTLEDVYFVIAYAFTNIAGTNMNQTRWYSESRGDWATHETVPSSLVPGSRPLTIGYGWDGVHPDIQQFDSGGSPFDNRGNPALCVGIMPGTSFMPTAEFTSSTTPATSTIHADRERSDDAR